MPRGEEEDSVLGEGGDDELDEELMEFITQLDRKIKARIRERLDRQLEELQKKKKMEDG